MVFSLADLPFHVGFAFTSINKRLSADCDYKELFKIEYFANKKQVYCTPLCSKLSCINQTRIVHVWIFQLTKFTVYITSIKLFIPDIK